MSYRTTIIIAILLILLGGYAYYFEYKGGQKKEEAKEKEKTLFEVKKEDVTQIEIEGIEPKPVILTPIDKENWRITQPLQTKADNSTVDRILNAFEKVKYKEIIEQQPKDLRSYELDKPKMTIRVNLKGKGQRAVSIGAKNPVDSVYYMRINNDPRVYLTEGSVGDLSTTTLLDLRDKKLTDLSTDKVEQVNLRTEKLDLQFKKQGGVWKMLKPVSSPASESEVSSLLSSLEGLRATKFIDEPDPDPAKYGFKTPLASVELVLEKGLRQRIDFGKAEGATYCRIEGNPTVATVEDSMNATFDKKLEDWREKKLVLFNRFDSEEFRVIASGKEYSLKKGQGDKWNELSPSKGEVEYDQIQNVLEKLENAEISKYVDQPKLDSAPVAEIFITTKDWQEKISKKHLAFGPVSDNQQQVKNDDYDTIVFTQASLLPELEKVLQDLKPKPPAPPAAKKK
jgi:Domain of unknown function (DUF4340)